jgi:hypothetical protein
LDPEKGDPKPRTRAIGVRMTGVGGDNEREKAAPSKEKCSFNLKVVIY